MPRIKIYVLESIFLVLVLLSSSSEIGRNGNSSENFYQARPLLDVRGKFQKGNLSILNPTPPPVVPGTSPFNNNTPGQTTYLPLVLNPVDTGSNSSWFYVSLTGNDTNPGTQALPWRTLQKAANTLKAGETVKILPGTYFEKFSPKNSGTSGAPITYTADPGTVILDGTGVSMSTDSMGDGLVQIQGKSYIRVLNLTLRNSTVHCLNISQNTNDIRSSYIEIISLNVQNCNKAGIYVHRTDHLLLQDNLINHTNYSSGIGVWMSNDVSVDHNTITNAHYYHECQGAYDEALTISQSNRFEVKNNTLDNNEANPPGFCVLAEKIGIDVKESSQNGKVYKNIVRHMNAVGIYVDGWHAGTNGTTTLNHIDIYQNLVSDGGGITVGCEQSDGIVEYISIYNNLVVNAAFTGIHVTRGHGNGLRKNIYIYNNTIYGALLAGGDGGAGIYITTSNLASNNGEAPVVIRNNISMFYFLNNGGGWVGQVTAADAIIASKVDADHNLVSGPLKCSQDFPSCVEVGSRITSTAAAVFNNFSAFDFHLKSGSPAINAGLTISLVFTDFDGFTRLQPYDIGAYEFK